MLYISYMLHYLAQQKAHGFGWFKNCTSKLDQILTTRVLSNIKQTKYQQQKETLQGNKKTSNHQKKKQTLILTMMKTLH